MKATSITNKHVLILIIVLMACVNIKSKFNEDHSSQVSYNLNCNGLVQMI